MREAMRIVEASFNWGRVSLLVKMGLGRCHYKASI